MGRGSIALWSVQIDITHSKAAHQDSLSSSELFSPPLATAHALPTARMVADPSPSLRAHVARDSSEAESAYAVSQYGVGHFMMRCNSISLRDRLVTLNLRPTTLGRSQRVRPSAGPMTGSACPRTALQRGHGAKSAPFAHPASCVQFIGTCSSLIVPYAQTEPLQQPLWPTSPQHAIESQP